MRPAFPTREFRSLLRSSRWRESMPQQAPRSAAIAKLQRPRPTRFAQFASVLQAASLHPSKEPIEQSKACPGIAAATQMRRRISE